MPGSLFDSNVWIAALFTGHPFHEQARSALAGATPALPAIFCRSTEQSFLRLATTPALLRAYGAEGLTNEDARVALETLLALKDVREQDEPPGTARLWHRLASRETASPKVLMDAYLAAFAIQGAVRFVTLDLDFAQYQSQGLDLIHLQTDP